MWLEAMWNSIDNRKDLMEHVKDCMPRKAYIDRFHVNCKFVLENNPDLTLSEFSNKVKSYYPEETAKLIADSDLMAYYNQFQTIFKMHQH